jgi:hypothetical protein
LSVAAIHRLYRDVSLEALLHTLSESFELESIDAGEFGQRINRQRSQRKRRFAG